MGAVCFILVFLASPLASTKLTADGQQQFLQCNVRFRLHPSFVDYFTQQSNFDETLTNRRMKNASLELVNEVNRVFSAITFATTTHKIRFELTSLVSMAERNCSPGNDTAAAYFCDPESPCQSFLDEYIQEIENQHCLDLLLINWPEFANICAFAAEASDSGTGVCANGTADTGPFNVGLVNWCSRQGINSRATVFSLIKTIGRLFGARDDPMRCQPGQPDGNFIMSQNQPPASGEQKNWLTFSPCSIEDMGAVLNEIRQGKRSNCLKPVSISNVPMTKAATLPEQRSSSAPTSNKVHITPAATSSTETTSTTSPASNNPINVVHWIAVVGILVFFTIFVSSVLLKLGNQLSNRLIIFIILIDIFGIVSILLILDNNNLL